MTTSVNTRSDTVGAPRGMAYEIALFAALVALANAPLLAGGVWSALVYVPELVAAGEWWRLATGPLVHVGLYHMALDAGAFLMLYHGLREPSRRWRLAAGAASAIGSTTLATAFMATEGTLCGLSGAAHGLMAYSALEMMAMRDRDNIRIGLACQIGVVLKSLVEAITGEVWFASLHLGDIGAPVAICHLGGVLGGFCVFACRTLVAQKNAPIRSLSHDSAI